MVSNNAAIAKKMIAGTTTITVATRITAKVAKSEMKLTSYKVTETATQQSQKYNIKKQNVRCNYFLNITLVIFPSSLSYFSCNSTS